MFPVRIVTVGVLALAMLTSARAQESRDSNQKQDAAIRKVQQVLDDPLIQSKDFAQEMPLAKFLDAVVKRLAQDKQMTLRIDRDALGDKYAEVAAMPLALPPLPKTVGVRMVLVHAMAKSKGKIDYRVEPAGIVLTTPKRAVFTAIYDIRDIVDKPERIGLFGVAFRNAERSKKGAMLVRSLLAAMNPDAERSVLADYESIEIVNGIRLVVRAGGARQAEFAQWIRNFHHLGDLSVIMKARLIEVDEESYKRVKNAKRLSMLEWEELERRFLANLPEKDPPFAVKRLKELVIGEEIKVNNGQIAGLLSKHRVIVCRAGLEQLRKGDKSPQIVVEGVAFLAEPQVSWDRRYLSMKITEKAAELEQIEKVKVWLDAEKEADAEVPYPAETTHTLSRHIPDGGTIIIPVHYQPRSAKDKNRWLVLVITARIWMGAEEQRIREGGLQDALPLIVADVLKNPALKAARDLYGTPGDKRFALVDSDAWTWSKMPPLAIDGHPLTPAKREGQRLLGIRVEKGDDGKITVALFNAGGITNGAAIGAVSLRYIARRGEENWTVELAETPDR